MKTKLCSVLCLVLMSWSTSNIAQITTFGETDCGSWVNKKKVTDRAWTLGYLSGANAAVSTSKNDFLNKIKSAEQIWLYVDKYCNNNPLSTVSEALDNLWIELIIKK